MSISKKTQKEIIIEEFKKCAQDPIYFIKKYCIIQHPKKGKIPFILFPYQENCLRDFREFNYNIILKGRQLGFSTLVAAYSLWMMIFFKDKNILVVATTQDIAKNLVAKVRTAYDNLPGWMKYLSKAKPIAENKLSLELENGSQVKAVSSSVGAVVSHALSLLIIDEAAHIERMYDIWTAAQPTLSTGGDCVILSTPNGVGNWFHEMWNESKEGINGFNPIRLDWSVHPERDQKWRDSQDKKLGKRKASQEHDASFLTSGNTVVDMEIIQYIKEKFEKSPIQKMGIDNGWWIWKHPIQGRSYIIAGDVARGDGADFSAAHIFDLESLEQVAEYKGLIDTRQFGRSLASMGVNYNNALVVVEREGIGWDTIQELIDIGYSNIFYSSNNLQYVDSLNQQLINNKINLQEKKMKPGFSTTMKTRPLIITKMESYFRDLYENDGAGIVINSLRTLNELETFIWKSGKPEAMERKNDDLVMALAILLWVRDTALRLRQEGIDLTKMTLDRFKVSTYNGIYTNKDRFDNQNNPYKWKINEENEENLMQWI